MAKKDSSSGDMPMSKFSTTPMMEGTVTKNAGIETNMCPTNVGFKGNPGTDYSKVVRTGSASGGKK